METLTQRVARALFDKAVAGLTSEDAAVKTKARDEVVRILDGLPGLSRDLLLGSLQAALEAADTARIAALEAHLPRIQADVATYQAAPTREDKLSLVQAWRTAGGDSAPPKEKTE